IVVARRVHMVADLRSADPKKVESARNKLVRDIAELARAHEITINVQDFDIRPIRYFPEAGVALAERHAVALGLSSRRLPTMAGHDSVARNRLVPTTMLFIPSICGVSHCEREFTKDEDMVKGLELLSSVTFDLVHGHFRSITE